MGQTGRDRRPADPLSILTSGLRQMGKLDLGDVRQAMAHLTNPDASFLDMLGRSREERVEKMATMLRNSSEADVEEMGVVFGLAMAEAGNTAAARPQRRRPDPVAMWADGVRRIGSFDLRDVWRGLENFSQPSAGGMLASLGHTRNEQVEKLTPMLATMSPADMEEMGAIYALAAARAAETPQESRLRGEAGEAPKRRRRGQTSAEWRRERRLAL